MTLTHQVGRHHFFAAQLNHLTAVAVPPSSPPHVHHTRSLLAPTPPQLPPRDGDALQLYTNRAASLAAAAAQANAKARTPFQLTSHLASSHSPAREREIPYVPIMGNFASCTVARAAGRGSGASVVLPDGRVRQVSLPATAAELMLEAPGHFLADARALRPGRRIEALAADEELQRGILYAALPMKRLGAPAAPADVARLAAAVVASGEKARSGSRRRRSGSSAAATAKVAAVVAPPEILGSCAAVEVDATKPRAPRLDEMDVDDAAAAAEIEELKQRLSGAGRRSRRPTLETIQEESYAFVAAA
ncbi:hypothetical protein EJB05_55777, partial [Eragrostis curvula]